MADPKSASVTRAWEITALSSFTIELLPASELHIKHVIVARRSLREELWLGFHCLWEVSSLGMIGGADRILTVNQRRRYNGQISSNGYVRAGTGSVEINAGLDHPIRTEEQSKAIRKIGPNIAMTSHQTLQKMIFLLNIFVLFSSINL